MSTPPRPARRTRPGRLRAVVGAAALVGCLGGLAAGCSGGSDGGPRPSAQPSASAARPEVSTDVRYGAVTGRLPRPVRQRLAERVRRVVDGWTAAAYLDGRYPRRAFDDAFPGFTPGARDRAHRDRALMSNEDVGTRIDGVVPRHSRLVLDVLAVRRRPVGVTAHVALAFVTTGSLQREVRVRGRLYLTPTDRGWRVFGYDMTKGTV